LLILVKRASKSHLEIAMQTNVPGSRIVDNREFDQDSQPTTRVGVLTGLRAGFARLSLTEARI
jgi:hypothetical protein